MKNVRNDAVGAMSPELRPLTLGILAIITCAAFEAMAVVTAMPVVARELSGESSYGLAFSMYLTASLLGTVVAGSWSDRKGPGPALGVGMALMIAGLLAAGAAPDFWLVTVGRAVSGLGGGFMIVAVYVVIGRSFPQQVQPVVFGWLAAAWVLPALVGPVIAGFVTVQFGWRWVFLGVAPIVLAAFLLVRPRTRRIGPLEASDTGPAKARTLRGFGLAGGVFAAQWAVVRLADTARSDAGTVWSLAVLAAAGVVVVLLVLPALLPRGTMVLARGLPSIIATRGFVNVAFFGTEAFIPLMLVTSRGIDPGTAGLTLSAGAIGWSAGSFVQARVSFDRKWLLVAGSSILSLSLGGFALATTAEAPLGVLALVWAFSGFAMGMTLSSTSVLVLKLSQQHEQGRNSAALQISDQLGGVVGTAGAGALFALLRDDGNPGHLPTFVVIWLALWVFTAAGIVSGLRGASSAEDGPDRTPSKSMEGTVPA
ncbi:MFS transporter [Arthrobacter echini]|uniref:MFS transporter n=1 Tax=Arthrobacter echini TaxID=1529066 RepID=A0A4S5E491_9MICC|nr:MFS transporter [Arthrobacter echini]THJ66220.1 MFS transporter [Arthrobacter echini]